MALSKGELHQNASWESSCASCFQELLLLNFCSHFGLSMSECLNAFVLALVDMLRTLLVTGFVALVLAGKEPVPPLLEHLPSNAHNTILKPLPVVPFTPGSPISLGRGNRAAKDRFKKTENYSHLHRYSGSPFGGSTDLGVSRTIKRQYGSRNITDLKHGLWYGVKVFFGTQELTLVLDTSSSDTWAFSTNTTPRAKM